jgi:fructose/tagatose bisphosphate aldolase
MPLVSRHEVLTKAGRDKGEPKLDFARLQKTNALTSCPLVLHGPSLCFL